MKDKPEILVRFELNEARTSMERAARYTDKALRQREEAILQAVEHGLTKREIADILGITVVRVYQIINTTRRKDT